MSNERFFRLLSIAILGGVALAFVPDSKAGLSTVGSAVTSSSNVQVSMVVPAALPRAVPIEVEAVDEVEVINAGRFNPALIIPSPVQTSTITQVDPNF